MNLTHGLESQPTAFLLTCGGISMLMGGVFAQEKILPIQKYVSSVPTCIKDEERFEIKMIFHTL
jgi:hypothetical protein